MEAEGKIAKQTGSLAWYARVRVACVIVEGDPGRPALAVTGGVPQTWTDAAVAGVSWALGVAGARAACTVTDVEGMVCDTNPREVVAEALTAHLRARVVAEKPPRSSAP